MKNVKSTDLVTLLKMLNQGFFIALIDLSYFSIHLQILPETQSHG